MTSVRSLTTTWVCKVLLLLVLVTASGHCRSVRCRDKHLTAPLNQNERPFFYNIEIWKNWGNPILEFLKTLGEKQVRKIYEDIKRGIETRLTCDTCEMVVGLARISVYSVSELNYLMASVCEYFNVEHSRVCQGLSDLFSEELYYILKHSNLSKSEVCATLIGADCFSDRCVHLNHWSINLHSHRRLQRRSHAIQRELYSRRQEPFNVLHLSDLHIDPFYESGANSACGEPLCCRSTSSAGTDRAGFWGDYHNCDSPKYTIEELMAYINTTFADHFQSVIWTGDIVAHDVWNTTRNTIINGSRALTSLIKRYIANGKQVFPVIGNHEGLPVNQFAPPQITGKLSIGWLYSELLNQWSDWIPERFAHTFKTYGYYANDVRPNLKVIVMNTNYCARLNFWLMYDSHDPGNQLKWLSEQLAEAEANGQFVHILGHIPPDNTQCTSLWVHNYLRIIERYNDTISGQFFGHTHFDEIRLLFSPNNHSQAIATAYLTPSVTPYMGVNPAFRVYSVNSKATVVDHRNYYLNLTEANANHNQSSLKWINEYSVKESYNISSLMTSEWQAFYEKMKSDDNVFQIYYNHYHRYSDAFSVRFDESLKRSILDSIPVVDAFRCPK